MRVASVLSAGLLTLAFSAAVSCVQGIGGEGQACSVDGKCAVGYTCQANVCQAISAAVGGAPSSSGGAVASGGASKASGGASDGGSGGETPSSGGSKEESGGAQSSGGSDGESGGAESSGGAEGVGGSDGSGGGSGSHVPPGTNLLANGDFSDGAAHWKCDCGSASSSGEKDGAYCIEGSGDVGIAFSAPGEGEDPFKLESGKTYVLYYRVKGAGSWEAKVGLSEAPYDAFGSFNDTVDSKDAYKEYTHEFNVKDGSDRVGFIFQGNVKSSACFDDVFIGVKE